MKAEAYGCLASDKEKLKHKLHLIKNANQHCREVNRRLKISEDMSISRLEILKYSREDHNQSNVVCE